ncbi:probable dolichyl pyrophosphate Glc1Man9GlcNAc2 alpha-1,3-glucosyltransferase [Chrysoperla carnea]|uniref:probable dolichyl pyrophosphate Glc1Man9GlcNAc2 alpha-1,3-glucosyltransferase n=1 Tax=Chrysoperla carnea TaxID=189513 RepID=UPI001D0661C2|nr:probable dolichyl pyrophosphate Glc1Man9GlcNAc2 alpha-1,3-glucosyltransferase [Chrysoperla carnea]
MIIECTLLLTCIKLLLIPAYHSTDFEVHRNWLAITHSLPVNKWYFEQTSEWTLDYPPLFAWFEFLLSHIAKYFDPEMLKISNLNYASYNTILFQRLSVIFTDFVYALGCCRCSRSFGKTFQYRNELFLILFGNIGLLMVDHIHFQYNGIMFGILLLSIANMIENQYRMSAFWFAILLCMKHIYAYIAPVYIIYLLRHYCFTENNKDGRVKWKSFSLLRLFNLGVIVLTVVYFTFAPFYNHIPQVFSRLFPFKRGLCHAYWAPNFWALYNFLDKFAVILYGKVGMKIPTNNTSAVMTGGLVQEYSHIILPTITPLITFLLTFFIMLPILIKLWILPKHFKALHFVRAIVLCAAVSFLFGWHVHEKAILLLIIPFSIVAVNYKDDGKLFLLLTTIGHYSLFPLLYPKNLLTIKVLLLLIYTTFVYYTIRKIREPIIRVLNLMELFYIIGLIPLFIYEHVLHFMLKFDEKLPFLPLMLTSVYCSLGVIFFSIRYYVQFLTIK